MVSSLGSPLHECVVVEGTSSLNHPLSHCHCHLSCSTLMVGCQWWLACVSYPYVSKMMPVRWMRILRLVCSVASWIYVKICCHLGKYYKRWRSVVRCVAVVIVGTRAPVMQDTVVGRSVEWSRATSMGVLAATTPISVVMGARLGATEYGSILVIMMWVSGMTMASRGGSPASVIGVSPVACQCTRWQYLVWAVHGNMSIIVTVVAPYMGAIACYMTNFLILETPVIITGHSVDWQGG